MKDSGEFPDTERLLRLASTLVKDAQQAEDVVQDAWVRGLVKRRGPGGLSAAYLRATVKNGVHNLFRDRDRRERREHDTAREASTSSTLDELETGEFRRILVEAIDALREPYRSTITHRFFDNMTPKEIASRKGVPDATVRSHLKRGLDGLRESLDSRYGRTSWIGGFALVLERETGTSPLAASEAVTRAPVGASMGVLPVAVGVLGLSAVAVFFGAKELVAGESVSDDGGSTPTTNVAALASAVRTGPEARVADAASVDLQAARARLLDVEATPLMSGATAGPGVLLHVRDVRTGAELADVRVVPTTLADYAAPSDSTIDDLEARVSPFVLAKSREVEPDAPVQCVWVGAPGYAWQRVLIDRSDPSVSVERFVALDSGAHVALRLTGFVDSTPPDGLLLFVRDADGALLWESHVQSDQIRVDEVPTGRVSLSVGTRAPAWGEASSDRMYVVRGENVVLGEVEVFAVPGRVVDATIVVAPPAPPATAATADFSLSLPANANARLYRDRVSVRVRPFEERLRAPAGEAALSRFEVRLDDGGRDVADAHELALVPGLYEVEVAPFCDRHVVRVESGAPIDITVPPLAEVHVRMDSAPFQSLFFHRMVEEYHAPIVSKWDVDGTTGECVAWLVPGRYLVQAIGAGDFAAKLARLEIEVQSGWNAAEFAELEVAPTTTMLEIEFRCAGARIPFDALPFAIEPIGHGGQAQESGMVETNAPGRYLMSVGWGIRDPAEDLVTRVLLTEPGEYEIAKFDFPSFRPLPVRRVSLRTGETRRILYELEPR